MSVHGRVLLLRPLPERELLITTYRRMGLEIVIADDPSSALAGLGDRFIPVAGLPEAVERGDLSELEEAVAVFHERHPVNAVITMLDSLLPSVGRINERLGLRGIGSAAGQHCFDKLLQRKALEDAGVRGPRFRVVSSPVELHAAAADLGYPLILKPADRSERRMAFRIDGPRALNTAVSTTALGAVPDAAWPEGCLAEQYLDGPEITLETVTFQGHTTVIAMSDRFPGPPPYFTELETVVPGAQPPEVRAAAVAQTVAALAALGVTDGATHTKFRVTTDGPVILEVSGSVAGGYLADMVEDALGVNLYEQHWRALTGWAPRPAPRYRGHCAARTLAGGLGRLRSVDLGRLPLRASDELQTLRLCVRPGDVLGPVTGRKNRHGWVVARGPDAEAARRAAALAQSEIRFLCD